MSASGNLEVEVKIRFEGDAAKLLGDAGFKITAPRIHEMNVVFDRGRGELRGANQLLRLRKAGGLSRITYKGPPQRSRHKSREEIEFDVSDPGAFELVLDRLGYSPRFRYEKYRTTYARPGEPGEVTVDETPIGVYLELEGPPEWIDATARRLGFAERDYITASYATLYEEYARANRSTATDMLFSDRRGL